MATYNTAFGSLPGYNEMLGTTNTTGGGQQNVYQQRTQQQRQQQQQPAPQQTFAQMQRQGMARPPAPTAPQAQPFQQFGGSQQAAQMRQRLQSQLEQFGQAPSRFDTQAFQQIRGAQQANLQSEFQEQQRQLNEDLARRGLSASNIAASGLGRLGGAQARALADIDAQLLQRAAEVQAQDRAQLLAEGRGLAELAASQDLAQFEANRVAQAATFENQLRAAQFGQQQFEQLGQEAFQAAQAEEAAQQAARQFDLAATGQAAGLSMDLQRLLGQQEVERAQLTGQLGGMQTLAAQQFGEQRRQFDIQQALQQQLGLGGLEVQRGQLGVEQQRLEQQGEQFRSQLNEQQAARLQQAGFTSTELAIKRSQVDNELSLQNRQLSEVERNNLALRELERDRFNSDADFRAEQLGLNRDELNQRADQIAEEQRLRGLEIDNEKAYREAEIEARTTQIQNEYDIAGRQIDEQAARRQAEKDINDANNTAQMSRINAQTASQERIATADRTIQQSQLNFQNAARLSEQSGVQYTVNAKGEVVPLTDAQGNPVRTSAFTQAEEARKLQEQELNIRRQLGMTEATGQVVTGFDEEGQPTFGADTLQASLQRRQMAFQNAARLSEQSGFQYTVTPEGNVEQLLVNNQPVRTSAFTQAEEARKLQQDEVNLRRQLGVMEATGQALTVDAQGRLVPATGEGAQTLQARQLAFQNAARLSEQSGVQYTVKADGTVDVLRDAQGNPVRTSAFTQADEARKQQDTLTRLDLQLRRQLGLTEATGQMYNIDPITGVATLATGAAGAQTVEARRVAAQERQTAIQSAMQLSEQSGVQYTVNENNQVVVLRDAQNQPVRTSAVTQSALDRALREQLGMMEATGQVYTVGPDGRLVAGGDTLATQLQRAQMTGTLGGAPTMQRLQQSLAEAQFMTGQTGNLYEVVGETGRLRTTGATTIGGQQASFERAQAIAQAQTQATGVPYTVQRDSTTGMFSVTAMPGMTQTEARRQFDLEQNLRRQLGMSEATGFVFGDTGARTTERTVQGQMAQNQMFMQLASILSNLTPEQFGRLTGGNYAPPSAPQTGQISADGAWRWDGRTWVANTSTRA